MRTGSGGLGGGAGTGWEAITAFVAFNTRAAAPLAEDDRARVLRYQLRFCGGAEAAGGVFPTPGEAKGSRLDFFAGGVGDGGADCGAPRPAHPRSLPTSASIPSVELVEGDHFQFWGFPVCIYRSPCMMCALLLHTPFTGMRGGEV